MILDYIEQAGKGKYQCFKTKKICLDSVDNDTIAYNYDDKTIANATKSTFAETDHSRIKTVSVAYLFKSSKVPPPIFRYFLDGSRHTFKIDDIGIGKKIFPIIAGQIIVGCCERKDRDTFKCWQLNSKIVMAMPDDYDDDDGGENFCRSFCETINSKVIDKLSKLKDLQLGIDKLLLYRTNINPQEQGRDNYKHRGIACIQNEMTDEEQLMVERLCKAGLRFFESSAVAISVARANTMEALLVGLGHITIISFLCWFYRNKPALRCYNRMRLSSHLLRLWNKEHKPLIALDPATPPPLPPMIPPITVPTPGKMAVPIAAPAVAPA